MFLFSQAVSICSEFYVLAFRMQNLNSDGQIFWLLLTSGQTVAVVLYVSLAAGSVHAEVCG